MAEQNNDVLCPFCLDNLRQPIVLVCKHTFCCTCLEDYVQRKSNDGRFQCPLCRQDIKVPTGGVKELSSTGNGLREETSETGSLKCDACKYNPSRFMCQECQQKFCNSCKTMHDELKNHKVIRLDEGKERSDTVTEAYVFDPRDICPQHREKKAKYYCEACFSACCFNCFVKDHSGHNCSLLKDGSARQHIRNEFSSMIEETKTHLKNSEEFSDDLKVMYDKATNLVETQCDKVDQQIEKLYTELKLAGETIKKDLIKAFIEENGREKINIRKLKEDAVIITEDIQASVKCSDLVLEDESVVQIINRMAKVRQENQQYCRKLDIPDLKMPELSFQEAKSDTQVLRKQLGSIIGGDEEDTNSSLGRQETFLETAQQTSSSGFFFAGYESSEDEYSSGSGSTSRDDTFEFRFEVGKVKRGPYHAQDFICFGVPWNIGVKRLKYDDDIQLEVYLKQHDNTTRVVNYTLELINFNDDSQSVIESRNKRFSYYKSVVEYDMINWSKVCNPKCGFLDDDDCFTIAVTLR